MTNLLALWGFAGAGKDAAAAALVEDGWRRDAFADRMRAMLYALNPRVATPYGPHQLRSVIGAYGWDRAKREVPEIRHLLQRLGTEAGREVLGENVWVDALMRGIRTNERVVVTDCRFPNEAEAIRAARGLVVAIVRPGAEPVNSHQSEVALRDYPFDFVIHNDRDIEHLHEVIRALVA